MGAMTGTVRVLVATGISPVVAIKAALNEPIVAYARRRGLNRSCVSACINGHDKAPGIRRILAGDLGITVEELGKLIDGMMT